MKGVGNNNPHVNSSGSANHSDQTHKAQTGKSGTSTTHAVPAQPKAIPAAQNSTPDTSIQSRKITTTTRADVDNHSTASERFNNALNRLKDKSGAKKPLQQLNKYLHRLKNLNTEHAQTVKVIDQLRRARAGDSDLCEQFTQKEEQCKEQIDNIRKKCQKLQNQFNGSVISTELKINVTEIEQAMAPGTHTKVELARAQASYEKYQQIIEALLPKLKK